METILKNVYKIHYTKIDFNYTLFKRRNIKLVISTDSLDERGNISPIANSKLEL